MKKYFPGSPDPAVWAVTGSMIGLLILLLALAGGLTSLPIPAVVVLYSLAGLLLLLVAVGWLARPLRYEVSDASVTIVRTWPFSAITIPVSEIKEIRHLTVESLRPASAVVAWVFGYSGRFRNDELGDFLLFATGTRETTLIAAKANYILSPSNPKRFVKHVHDLMGR